MRAALPITPILGLALALTLVLVPPLAVSPGAAALAQGDGPAARGRVVLVFVPALDWPELRDALAAGRLPHLGRLVAEGAVGLANSLTGARVGPWDSYATLGAGMRAAGGVASGDAFQRGEAVGDVRAEEAYRARLGRRAPSGAILHAGLGGVRVANERLENRAEPGALGDALHRAGIRTALLGNADLAPAPGDDATAAWEAASLAPGGSLRPGQGPPSPAGRWAALAVMDSAGAVDEGLIDARVLRRDAGFPGGWRTDYDALVRAFRRVQAAPGGVPGGGAAPPALVAVETGDLWRLEAERERMGAPALARHRLRALGRADDLVGRLKAELDPRHDLLLVVSPFPSEGARRSGGVLTPVLAWGGGWGPGLITAPTTRQPGLITLSDVAPTALAALGLAMPGAAPPGMLGRPASVLASPPHGVAAPDGLSALQAVDGLYRAAMANHQRRPLLVKVYIFSQIIALLVALWAVSRRVPGPSALGALLVSLTAAPLAFLLLPLLPVENVHASYGASLALVALITGLSLVLGRRNAMAPFLGVSLVTVAAVLFDVVRGSQLMVRSPLGHSAIGGARYYGIGNEYMGVLLGASLVGGAALLDRLGPPGCDAARRGRWLVLAGWLGVTVTLAAPSLGANFGGAIAGAAAFCYAGLRLLWPGLAVRRLAAVATAAGVAAAGLAVALDVSRDAAVQTHIGQAAAGLGEGGWRLAADLIGRKVAMNLKLIRWTNWSLVFLTSLGAYAWLMLRPPRGLRPLLTRHPHLGIGLSGVAVAALAALVLNDSGIVAAATTMIFASAPLTHLVVGEFQHRPVPEPARGNRRGARA